MECHRISRILGLKVLTKRDNKLGFVLRLKVLKEHVITHMVRGILDIS